MAGTLEGTLDEGVIVQVDASVETITVNFIDSGEVTGCNLVWGLPDHAETVFDFVKMTGGVRGHVSL